MRQDILFLGRLFPREKEAEIKAKMKTGMQDAANALQWNIIDGLEENSCGKIKIVNYLPIDSYPRGYIDKKISGFLFQHTKKYRADDVNVAFNNMTIVKQFVNFSPFKDEIKKWATDGSTDHKVLICYTASVLFLKLAKYAKEINSSIQTCCIIADIPEFATATDLRGIRKMYNQYNVGRCAKLFRFIDKFVLLTEQMAEKLNIKVPYMVMEGIAPSEELETSTLISEKYFGQKYALYSGTLNYKFGIDVLLKAFSQMKNNDAKLIICGWGEAETEIRKLQSEKIIFLGRLDRKAVLPLQKNATVLVNPRQNNEEFTKYSFPSKTMEYLATGVPVVAYKLNGIPAEYDAYLQYVLDDSPEALAQTIQSIFEKTEQERLAIGKKGKEFVLHQKNAKAQTKKILDFIKEGV